MHISTDFYRKSCALTYKMFVAAIHNRPSPLEGEEGVRLLSVLDCGYRWDNGSLKPSTHRATAAKRTPSAMRSAARWRTNRAIAIVVGPVIAHLLTCLFATEKI